MLRGRIITIKKKRSKRKSRELVQDQLKNP